jgi:predicted RecB family endonuclease
MNQERRKILQGLSGEIVSLRGRVEEIKDEESEKLDRMPDNMKSGEKGQELEEIVEKLTEAVDNLETASGCIDEIA